MQDILFVAHRIPYPPDKGEKIRAWNILRHLAATHRVHLAAFIDDPDDVRHLATLEKICASVVWRPLSPRWAKLRSLAGLLRGESLTQGYFRDRRLVAAVDAIIEQHRPMLVYVFSSAMAPYVAHRHGARVIVDIVDVDSEKWRQYAAASSGLKRLVYAREGRLLLALEREAAGRAEAVLLVSRAEAELFTRHAPEASSHTQAVRNGVDTEYFDPSLAFPDPFEGRAALVFTGMMNYRPNIDAMVWFSAEVMPKLREHPAKPVLWIVGANPSREILALAGPDVKVTGRVPDVRPYLKHARVVVAPLRIARGVQNKVLEAMAMGAAVVATPQAREGLDDCHSDELLIAANASAFAEAVVGILDRGGGDLGKRARARALRDYGWSSTLAELDRLLGAEAQFPTTRDGIPAVAGALVRG